MQEQSASNEQLINAFITTGKIEGYSYLVLLFIAMPLKYMFQMPQWVSIVGMIHGVLFIAFIILILMMMVKAGLSFKKAFFAFLLSLVPFGTFYLRRIL
jgi:integral membrane protein